MGIKKKLLLFCTGGCSYVALELLWRGRSHGSMFLAGGSSFLLLGALERRTRGAPVLLRGAAGAGVITAVELLAGLAANRDHKVWDYRTLPMNYRGQICLPYCVLWLPVSLAAMKLYKVLNELASTQ